MSDGVSELVLLLQLQNEELINKEKELVEKAEELEAQKEELNAAIEEVLRKNDHLNATLAQLQERNTELDQLVYRTSHELKAPVLSTLGIVYLMDFEQLNPPMNEYSKKIKICMQQMQDLLQSIALFTKAALDNLRNESVDLKELITIAASELKYIKGYEEIKISTHFDPSLVTISDTRLLIEAIKAVIGNAIIFRTQSNPYIHIAATKSDNFLILMIEDNGEGMTKEIAQQAFSIFYRGSIKSKGSGFGLYICQKIMNRLGGTIELIPQKIGLKVKISIPILDI